jgi:hypothetical protein
LEVFYVILFLAVIAAIIIVPCVIIFKVMVSRLNDNINTLWSQQAEQRRKLSTTLESRTFKIEKMVYIPLPRERYYLRSDWIPAVGCYLCVDNTAKKWAIAYKGNQQPKIYNYSDFTGFDVEINGLQAGDTTNNAIIGFIFGGLIGAAAGAAITRKFGTVKTMTMKIRVNDFANPLITIPLVTAPLQGFKEDEIGLTFIMTFASEVEQTFKYIRDNTKSIINNS